MTERKDMEAVFEAVLFVANEPVPREKILMVFDEKEKTAAEAALDAVCERYRSSVEGGIILDEAAGGVRLVTRPDLHGYLRRFFEVSGSGKLSMAALETLAIIAYRQPVTAPEIQELRSVSSSGVLKTLLERHLVRIAGRKEVVGKPFLYTTTRDFLMHFGLRNLKDLPPLEQFEELFGYEEGEGEGLEGPDHEEEVLREASEIEEAAADAAAEAAMIAEEQAVAEAELLEIPVTDGFGEGGLVDRGQQAAATEPAGSILSGDSESAAESDEADAGSSEAESESSLSETEPDPMAGVATGAEEEADSEPDEMVLPVADSGSSQ